MNEKKKKMRKREKKSWGFSRNVHGVNRKPKMHQKIKKHQIPGRVEPGSLPPSAHASEHQTPVPYDEGQQLREPKTAKDCSPRNGGKVVVETRRKGWGA